MGLPKFSLYLWKVMVKYWDNLKIIGKEKYFGEMLEYIFFPILLVYFEKIDRWRCSKSLMYAYSCNILFMHFLQYVRWTDLHILQLVRYSLLLLLCTCPLSPYDHFNFHPPVRNTNWRWWSLLSLVSFVITAIWCGTGSKIYHCRFELKCDIGCLRWNICSSELLESNAESPVV